MGSGGHRPEDAESTRVSVVEVETPGPKAGRTFGLAQTETAWVLLDLEKVITWDLMPASAEKS